MADPAPRRWRVLLVRLPAGGGAAVALPGGRAPDPSELPVVVRATGDAALAAETAAALRASGAVVVVVDEPAEVDPSAFCSTHAGRFAARACLSCRRPVCTSCAREAGGEDLCPACRAQGRSPRRRVRLRQLFLLFLFAVFLWEVAQDRRTDRARTDPFGPVPVGVYQFAPPGAAGSAAVRVLNGAGRGSLRELADWWTAERQRFGAAASPWLHLVQGGPWSPVPAVPAAPARNAPVWRHALTAWRAQRAWLGAARAAGADPDAVGVRLFIVWGRGGDVAAHSRGSEKGRIAVVHLDLDERNPAYAQVAVAHELAHTLGALDQYTPEGFLAAYPAGYVEPFATPLFPQRFAELMAVDLPLSLTTEREVASLDEVRIGPATAAAMGWLPPEQAALFYAPPGLGPMDLLAHPFGEDPP